MSSLPFPSNENVSVPPAVRSVKTEDAPWKVVGPGEPVPLTLQLAFSDGRIISFAISDIRETHKRDSGHVEIFVYGMEKYRITIEGRHLDELFSVLQLGRIRIIVETGHRTFDHPEGAPAIEKIGVESLTGPSESFV